MRLERVGINGSGASADSRHRSVTAGLPQGFQVTLSQRHPLMQGASTKYGIAVRLKPRTD